MQHVDIEDPNIHEPKGISTATAGQVYVADGAGSGSWTDPTFGALKIVNNSNSFTPDAGSAYKQLTTANGVPWTASEYSGVTLNTDSITLDGAGIYRIEFWGTIETAAADNSVIGIKYAINGTLDDRILLVQKNGTGTDTYACSAFGLVSVTDGAVLTLWAYSDVTTTFKLVNAGLSVHKLK